MSTTFQPLAALLSSKAQTQIIYLQMTGGVGRKNLTAFYRDHFIFALVARTILVIQHSDVTLFRNPADATTQTISRTVGPDRVVGVCFFFLIFLLFYCFDINIRRICISPHT